MTLHLPDHLRAEIVAHCRSEAPNEGCGLIAVSGGLVVEVYRTTNADRSPTGFTIPPEEHYEALSHAESRGWEIGGVFHSHPNGSARPSQRDVTGALDPDWLYLVVGLSGEPQIRAWQIRDNRFSEVSVC